MKKENDFFAKFSPHLFWDTEISTIEPNLHSKFIIARVLQYGNYSDWKTLVAYFGISTIIETATRIKELDKRTASFLSTIANIPKTNFQCYTTTQYTPKHWNF